MMKYKDIFLLGIKVVCISISIKTINIQKHILEKVLF